MGAVGLVSLLAACGDDGAGVTQGDAAIRDAALGATMPVLEPVDPGSGPWEAVPREDLVARCGLDPDRMDAADTVLPFAYAVARHGLLCWEHYPADAAASGPDAVVENFSATKTLSAAVLGVIAKLSSELPATGPRTGPLSDMDRMDAWMDDTHANPDALVAHVLAMQGHNADLTSPNRTHIYDGTGRIINDVLDVAQAVIDQDPDHFGATTVKELAQRRLFNPLGMTSSVWEALLVGFSWASNVRDMLRFGLLLNRYGRWAGAQLIGREWVYRMTHPADEAIASQYGYLTWLQSSNPPDVQWFPDDPMRWPWPVDDCSPPAIFAEHPHGISRSADCGYGDGFSCDQAHDVGVWLAYGTQGQHIVGHRGLDLVLVNKYARADDGTDLPFFTVWKQVRKALVAADPTYAGDEAAFCRDYAAGRYAPDAPDL
jgi:hypothetical protein